MVQGLVITHGKLGSELIKVVGQVMGMVGDLTDLSNEGLSALTLQTEIACWLDRAEVTAAGAILFIDDFGGSCASSAQLACGEQSQVVILSGVNLAMLLAFVSWRESLPLPELSQRLVEKGRSAIVRIGQTGRPEPNS
ncbi:MAG: hypothetical protein ABIF77_06305 [bacterium]